MFKLSSFVCCRHHSCDALQWLLLLPHAPPFSPFAVGKTPLSLSLLRIWYNPAHNRSAPRHNTKKIFYIIFGRNGESNFSLTTPYALPLALVLCARVRCTLTSRAVFRPFGLQVCVVLRSRLALFAFNIYILMAVVVCTEDRRHVSVSRFPYLSGLHRNTRNKQNKQTYGAKHQTTDETQRFLCCAFSWKTFCVSTSNVLYYSLRFCRMVSGS